MVEADYALSWQQSVALRSLQRTANATEVEPAYVWIPQMFAAEVSPKMLAYWDRSQSRPIDDILDEFTWRQTPRQIDVSFDKPTRSKATTTVSLHSYNFAR